MTAQEQWKRAYGDFRRYAHWKTDFRFSHSVDVMNKVRREAALERKLEAAQRKIAEIEATLKDIATAPYEDQPNDGNEWEKEYYLRGMHR